MLLLNFSSLTSNTYNEIEVFKTGKYSTVVLPTKQQVNQVPIK